MLQPAKRRKLDLSEEFKVVVGIKGIQKTFTVAKQFLTKSSGFFRKACSGDWKENETKTINLPEGTPEVFSIYLQWLYAGELVISDTDVPSKVDVGASVRFDREQYHAGIELYILADSIMDVPLQNSTMDYLSEALINCTISPGEVEVIQAVEGTMAGCPLRRFLADSICRYATQQWFQECGGRLLADFSVELLFAYAASRVSGTVPPHPCDASRCHYHVHDDDNPKCE